MSRLLIVANRLPITLSRVEGELRVERSPGGLATGLAGPHAQSDALWIGWPGEVNDLDDAEQKDLARRLDELRAGDIATALLDAYQRYGTFQCRWVDWRRLDEALVAQATTVIPGDHLLAIWERMLFDPGENRRGFPDLLALGNDPGDYQFIEVKGPGDALQESQKRWLRFFDRQGIPAAVAWVTWQESGAAGAGRDPDD